MSVNWEAIKEEWESTGITLIDLAEKHGVKEGTLKSRKSREKWEKVATKKDASKNKKMQPSKKVATAEIDLKESDYSHFDEEDGITDKQRLFCIYYVQTLNATSAYKKAYGCSRNTAMVEGSKCLRKPKVKAIIDRMKAEQLAEAEVGALDVLNMYKKIAFADITDFIDFTQVESHAEETVKEFAENGSLKKETSTKIPYTYTKFAMHRSEEIDGTLVTALERGKDGVFKVKLADKMAALAFLAKYTDVLDEKGDTEGPLEIRIIPKSKE